MPSTVVGMVDESAVVWYNPHCSKCIGADEELLVPLLERGKIG